MTKRWYVVQCYPNFEKKVAQAIEEAATKKGLAGLIDDIMVPSETVVETKRGRKVATEHSVFPGYILMHMDLDDDIWHMVRDIPRVTGFLGGRLRPTPISEAEVQRLMQQKQESVERGPRTSVRFEVGESVRVADGPFASFIGTVEEIDEDKERLKVTVSIFGRATPVDLEFSQIEKT
jgi:transcriptional antiterminator NusG